jgi:hypothetical protein
MSTFRGLRGRFEIPEALAEGYPLETHLSGTGIRHGAEPDFGRLAVSDGQRFLHRSAESISSPVLYDALGGGMVRRP